MLSDKLMSNSRIQSYILDLDQKGECDTVTQCRTSLSYACRVYTYEKNSKIYNGAIQIICIYGPKELTRFPSNIQQKKGKSLKGEGK